MGRARHGGGRGDTNRPPCPCSPAVLLVRGARPPAAAATPEEPPERPPRETPHAAPPQLHELHETHSVAQVSRQCPPGGARGCLGGRQAWPRGSGGGRWPGRLAGGCSEDSLHHAAWTARVGGKTRQCTCAGQTLAVQGELDFPREVRAGSDPSPPHLYRVTRREQAPFAFS